MEELLNRSVEITWTAYGLLLLAVWKFLGYTIRHLVTTSVDKVLDSHTKELEDTLSELSAQVSRVQEATLSLLQYRITANAYKYLALGHLSRTQLEDLERLYTSYVAVGGDNHSTETLYRRCVGTLSVTDYSD